MKDSELVFGLMAAYNKQEYTIADLTHLTIPFGMTDTSLRTNLSRMASKGILASRHDGKKVYYRFSEKGNYISTNIASSFTVRDWSGWDGKWWGVLFSVPDVQKTERHYIRTKLAAYRFSSLYPGFWVRPLLPEEKLEAKLAKIFTNPHCRVIRFDFYDYSSLSDLKTLWDFQRINAEFRGALNQIKASLARYQNLKPIEALVERMIVGEEIVKAMEKDPLLPEIFLPQDWLGQVLKEQFQSWDRMMATKAEPYVALMFNE